MSLMQRSLALLRARGYELVRKVEVWNSFAHKRQDLWGFDILAAGHGHLLFVQVTDAEHYAEHMKDLLDAPEPDVLKRSGARLTVHSWGLRGARGKRKTWQCREVDVGMVRAEAAGFVL